LITLAVCAVGLIPTAAYCDKSQIKFRQTFGVERTNELYYQDGVLQAGLEMTAFSNSAVTLQRRLASRVDLRFGADLLITGFPETGSNTEVQVGASVEAIRKFGPGNIWQGHLKFEVDRKVEGSDWTFNRARIGARLRYRHDRQHSTAAHLRLGYRDQNEATFEGFDQAEYLAQFSHAWRPWADRRSLTGTVYVEARRAENDRYSYDELGLRLAARYPIVDGTELTARLTVYDRSCGSNILNVQRNDVRILGTVTLTHEITEQTQLDVFVGWDDNRSTSTDRAYQGAVVGVSITMKF
jgi:hypothetical protein